MNRFLSVLGAVLILLIMLVSCFGLWHFVNSEAAEAQSWVVVESVTKVVVMLGTGLLIVLICLGAGGFIFLTGHGVRAGAEPLANAVGIYLLAKHDVGRDLARPAIAPPQEPRFFECIMDERHLLEAEK